MNSRLTTAYDTLREDLEVLAIDTAWTQDPPTARYMWSHIRDLVEDIPQAKLPPESFQPQTRFAQGVVALLESLPPGMSLADNYKSSGFWACLEAEPRFCTAVKLRGTKPLQSVILEADGTAKAILKTADGDEPSILCVEDAPEYAMRAGTMYITRNSAHAHQLKYKASEQDGPSMISLDELTDTVGDLVPIRTTTFTLDSKLRKQMGAALGGKKLYATKDLRAAANRLITNEDRALATGRKVLAALTG